MNVYSDLCVTGDIALKRNSQQHEINSIAAGTGLSSNVGSDVATLNVDFAGSGGLLGTQDTVSRSDHEHSDTVNPSHVGGEGVLLSESTESVTISVEFAGNGSNATASRSDHNHDSSYYSQTFINTSLETKSNTFHNHDLVYSALGHNHDSEYYGQTFINTSLNAKSDIGHAHSAGSITTDVSNFNGNLSGTDLTVQQALDTLDDLMISATASVLLQSNYGNDIQATFDAASDGDIVILNKGVTDIGATTLTLSNRIMVVGHGTGQEGTTITGTLVAGTNPIIQIAAAATGVNPVDRLVFNGFTLDGDSIVKHGFKATLVDLDHITFCNIEVKNCDGHGFFMDVSNGTDWLMDQCTFYNNSATHLKIGSGGVWKEFNITNSLFRKTGASGTGMYFSTGYIQDLILRDCVINECGNLGIYLYDEGNDVKIEKCSFSRNGWGLTGGESSGIKFSSHASAPIQDVAILNCVFDRNGEGVTTFNDSNSGTGIIIKASGVGSFVSDVLIDGCTFIRNKHVGIRAYAKSSGVMDDNLIVTNCEFINNGDGTDDWGMHTLYSATFAATIDTNYNYWGSEDGPGGTGSGHGNAITSGVSNGINLTSNIQHPAENIYVDTSSFAGNLSGADDTVQKALDTLDDLSVGGGGGDFLATTGGTMSGDINMGGNALTNVSTISFSGSAIENVATINVTSGGTIDFSDTCKVRCSDSKLQFTNDNVTWGDVVTPELQAGTSEEIVFTSIDVGEFGDLTNLGGTWNIVGTASVSDTKKMSVVYPSGFPNRLEAFVSEFSGSTISNGPVYIVNTTDTNYGVSRTSMAQLDSTRTLVSYSTGSDPITIFAQILTVSSTTLITSGVIQEVTGESPGLNFRDSCALSSSEVVFLYDLYSDSSSKVAGAKIDIDGDSITKMSEATMDEPAVIGDTLQCVPVDTNKGLILYKHVVSSNRHIKSVIVTTLGEADITLNPTSASLVADSNSNYLNAEQIDTNKAIAISYDFTTGARAWIVNVSGASVTVDVTKETVIAGGASVDSEFSVYIPQNLGSGVHIGQNGGDNAISGQLLTIVSDVISVIAVSGAPGITQYSDAVSMFGGLTDTDAYIIFADDDTGDGNMQFIDIGSISTSGTPTIGGFLNTIGGTMLGELDLGHNNITNVNTMNFCGNAGIRYEGSDNKLKFSHDLVSWNSLIDENHNHADLQTYINTSLETKSGITHNHDGDYSALGHNHDGSYSALGHDHDSEYYGQTFINTSFYTQTFINTSLDAKSDTGHNHDGSYSALGHDHDSEYYSQTFINTSLDAKSDIDHNHSTISITVNTTNFNNNLSGADDTVQKALDTLDDLDVSGGDFLSTTGGTMSGDINMDGNAITDVSTLTFSGSAIVGLNTISGPISVLSLTTGVPTIDGDWTEVTGHGLGALFPSAGDYGGKGTVFFNGDKIFIATSFNSAFGGPGSKANHFVWFDGSTWHESGFASSEDSDLDFASSSILTLGATYIVGSHNWDTATNRYAYVITSTDIINWAQQSVDFGAPANARAEFRSLPGAIDYKGDDLYIAAAYAETIPPDPPSVFTDFFQIMKTNEAFSSTTVFVSNISDFSNIFARPNFAHLVAGGSVDKNATNNLYVMAGYYDGNFNTSNVIKFKIYNLTTKAVVASNYVNTAGSESIRYPGASSTGVATILFIASNGYAFMSAYDNTNYHYLIRSTNGGVTWAGLPTGPTVAGTPNLAITSPSINRHCRSMFEQNGRLFVTVSSDDGTADEVFISEDYGDNWSLMDNLAAYSAGYEALIGGDDESLFLFQLDSATDTKMYDSVGVSGLSTIVTTTILPINLDSNLDINHYDITNVNTMEFCGNSGIRYDASNSELTFSHDLITWNSLIDVNHNHDSSYYSQTFINTSLASKSDTSHTHTVISNSLTILGDLDMNGNAITNVSTIDLSGSSILNLANINNGAMSFTGNKVTVAGTVDFATNLDMKHYNITNISTAEFCGHGGFRFEPAQNYMAVSHIITSGVFGKVSTVSTYRYLGPITLVSNPGGSPQVVRFDAPFLDPCLPFQVQVRGLPIPPVPPEVADWTQQIPIAITQMDLVGGQIDLTFPVPVDSTAFPAVEVVFQVDSFFDVFVELPGP